MKKTRKLTKEELEYTIKGLKTLQEQIDLDTLTKTVITKELELLPLKQKIAEHVKKQELKMVTTRLEMNTKYYTTQKKHITKGVEVKT